MNSKLIILVGAPASGKSTYSKKLEQASKNVVRISRDEIREVYLHGMNWSRNLEKEVYKKYKNNIISELKEEGKVVIADATHFRRNVRQQLIEAVKQEHSHVVVEAHVFNTPLAVCVERNSVREGRASVPQDRLETMFNDLQQPILTEGFDKIIAIKD